MDFNLAPDATTATIIEQACTLLELPREGSLLARALACWKEMGSPPLPTTPQTSSGSTLSSSNDASSPSVELEISALLASAGIDAEIIIQGNDVARASASVVNALKREVVKRDLGVGDGVGGIEGSADIEGLEDIDLADLVDGVLEVPGGGEDGSLLTSADVMSCLTPPSLHRPCMCKCPCLPPSPVAVPASAPAPLSSPFPALNNLPCRACSVPLIACEV